MYTQNSPPDTFRPQNKTACSLQIWDCLCMFCVQEVDNVTGHTPKDPAKSMTSFAQPFPCQESCLAQPYLWFQIRRSKSF